MVSADEQAQLASDLLESLDDLYDRCISVAQLLRLLTSAAIALRGSALGPFVGAAAEALAAITKRRSPEADKNTAALIATDELRVLVGSSPPTSHALQLPVRMGSI